MNCISTNGTNGVISVSEAVLKGLAQDGGLYLPQTIPIFPASFMKRISHDSFPEIAFEISRMFLESALPSDVLRKISEAAFTFDIPFIRLEDNLFILELFHGPTCAFKDFGARFMAFLLPHLFSIQNAKITVLVATSGDTGGAVASAFFEVPSVNVVILYPRGLISKLQESQLTAPGGNVTAIEVDGTFDDCQQLVKQAFLDVRLRKKCYLVSANSINIARLIPQIFYYVYAYVQLLQLGFHERKLLFSIPSGNLGNLVAGVIAKKMGLPITKFIAAVNANNVFPSYLRTGSFIPRPSVATLSNAMDVGNPSNITRLLSLYNYQHSTISEDIFSQNVSDEETKAAMREVFKRYSYLLDPHTAVGYLGIRKFQEKNLEVQEKDNFSHVLLATAHPAKFTNLVQEVTSETIPLPPQLSNLMKKENHSQRLSNNYEDLAALLQEGLNSI